MEKEILPVGQIDTGLLPCMPHVLLKLLTMEDTEPIGGCIAAIGNDPALTARVISAWRAFGAEQRDAPASIAGAVTALGTERVRAIIRNAAIQQVFSPFNNHAAVVLKQHWWRAVLCANLAELLAQQTAYPHPKEARLGGLLSALDPLAHPLAQWTSTLKQGGAQAPDQTQVAGSQNNLHSRVAAGLALEWRLHPFLIDALRYYQEAIDQLADTHPLVRIVHLANRLANHMTGMEALPLDAGQLFFGLDTRTLDSLAAAARQSATDTARAFGVEFEAAAPTTEPPAPPSGDRRLNRNALAGILLPGDESPLDAQVKRDLAREVRDLARIDSVRDLLRQAQGFDAVLTQCAEAAHLLFGLASPLYLVADQDDKLRAYPLPGQDPRALELTLPAQGGHSLAAASLGKNRPLNSFSDQSGSVLDQQICRLLSSSGVLYLPFAAPGARSALAAFGIERHQLARLEKRRRLLGRFGRACTQALQSEADCGTPNAEPIRDQLSAMQIQARRVVHEVNNPLSIMKNYVKLLSLKLADDAEARNDLRIFNDEIDRIAAIIRSLTHPSAPAASAETGIDINRIVRDLLELTADTLFVPAKISVVTHLADALPRISIQRDKLKQILLNILKNAAEAMPDGGTITVTTQDGVNRDGRPYIAIVIADTGPGLPCKVMAQLFEPVASTKGGDHAGLGLAIVNKLVEEIHASVTCISERSGLTVQLLIPRTIAGG